MLSRNEIQILFRGEYKGISHIGIPNLLRFSNYSKFKQKFDNWEEIEGSLLNRTEILLSSIFEMLECSDENELIVTHLILNTCLEYLIDDYLLDNPRVPSGTVDTIRRHRRAVRDAAEFFFNCQEIEFPGNVAFRIDSEILEPFNKHSRGAYLRLINETMSAPTTHVLYYISAIIAIMEIESLELEKEDRKNSPKRNFADKCILIYQSSDKRVSTSPNSDFMSFVALVFELATGEEYNAIEGAVKRAWKDILDAGGIHPIIVQTLVPEFSKDQNSRRDDSDYSDFFRPLAEKIVEAGRLGGNLIESEFLAFALANTLLKIKDRTVDEEAWLRKSLKTIGLDHP